MCRGQGRVVSACGSHAISAVISYVSLWRTLRVKVAAATGAGSDQAVAVGAGRIHMVLQCPQVRSFEHCASRWRTRRVQGSRQPRAWSLSCRVIMSSRRR